MWYSSVSLNQVSPGPFFLTNSSSIVMDSHHQHQQQHQQCYHFHQQGQAHSSTREHMFEKPLTPSDVGKLNRLVIPKQQAERHFPLDTDSGEKGLLLSFEDESGKAWVFRYSYWTSSQSYVLTKGWSRFVKEKQLDAGDTVLFERHRPGRGGDLDDHLYIGCRRRVSETAANAATPPCFYTNGAGEQAGAAAAAEMAAGSTKRLRLFGVNLECEPDRPDSWSQFMPTNASTSQL